VVVSPLIPRGTIDKTVHDHGSLLATVERLYGMDPLTGRDGAAASFDHLLSLAGPRDDAPARLPDPAPSGLHDCAEEPMEQRLAGDLEHPTPELAGELEPALAGFLQVAVAREIHLVAAVDRDVSGAIERERDRLLSTLDGINTKFDAVRFLREVDLRYARHREAGGGS